MGQDGHGYIQQPRKWEAGGIARFMILMVLSVPYLATPPLELMYWIFKATAPAQQSLFQSGWFIEGLLPQTLIVHMILAQENTLYQSWATAPVASFNNCHHGHRNIYPFSPFAAGLRLQPLPLAYFPWLTGILLCYCIAHQTVKTWFIRKFNQWL